MMLRFLLKIARAMLSLALILACLSLLFSLIVFTFASAISLGFGLLFLPMVTSSANILVYSALGLAAVSILDKINDLFFCPQTFYRRYHAATLPIYRQAVIAVDQPIPAALFEPEPPLTNLTASFNSTLDIIKRIDPGHNITCPDDFKDPISHDIMSEPVAVTDSLNAVHYYDRTSLANYYQTEILAGKAVSQITDPLSRQPIKKLQRDFAKRDEIKQYLQATQQHFSLSAPTLS
jgi:hypothetical protein